MAKREVIAPAKLLGALHALRHQLNGKLLQ